MNSFQFSQVAACGLSCTPNWETKKCWIKDICNGLPSDYFSGMPAQGKESFLRMGDCSCLPFNALSLAVGARNIQSCCVLLQEGADMNDFKDTSTYESFLMSLFPEGDQDDTFDRRLISATMDTLSDTDFANAFRNPERFAQMLPIMTIAKESLWIRDLELTDTVLDPTGEEVELLELLQKFKVDFRCREGRLPIELDFFCPCTVLLNMLISRGIETRLIDVLFKLGIPKPVLVAGKFTTVESSDSMNTFISELKSETAEYKGNRIFVTEQSCTGSVEMSMRVELPHTGEMHVVQEFKFLENDSNDQNRKQACISAFEGFRDICTAHGVKLIEFTKKPKDGLIIQKADPKSLMCLSRNVIVHHLPYPLFDSVPKLPVPSALKDMCKTFAYQL